MTTVVRRVVPDEFYDRSHGEGKSGYALRVIDADCRRSRMKWIMVETKLGKKGARRRCERHSNRADTSIRTLKELT